MKAKAWAVVSSLLFSIILIYADTRQEAQGPGSEEKMEQKSLVRKDLLKPKQKQLSPPLRNIFTRQRIIPSGERPGIFGTMGEPSRSGIPSQPGSKNEITEISINVTYIGYVNSEERVIALIVLDGETYAVESGDLLEGGVHIGEITPDDIEVIGPDSESNKVKLEGEKS